MQHQMKILLELQREKAQREAAELAAVDAAIAELPKLPKSMEVELCLWPWFSDFVKQKLLIFGMAVDGSFSIDIPF